MRTRRIISLVLAAVSLPALLSCEGLRTRNYDVDKLSPGGTYRVKIKVRVKDEGNIFGSFTEEGKVQFFKGQEVVDNREWKRTDTFEPTFIEHTPVVEWEGDNVLRMGRERTKQPFMDELTVANNSGEHLKHVSVGYVRFESFQIFDLAPGGEITLHASPEFDLNRPSDRYDSYVSYGGTARSGKEFNGFLENEQGRFLAGGQLKFQITINPKDLRQQNSDERK
jgi:hypothetical protein